MRGGAVPCGVAGAVHRVHQVDDGVDALAGPAHVGRVLGVAAGDVDQVAPRVRGELGRGAGEHPHVVAGVEQAWDEPGPDVAGGTEDEHEHGVILAVPGAGRAPG